MKHSSLLAPDYRTWATIRTQALKHNLHHLRAAQPAGTKIVSVIKADAYGHGALGVAPILEPGTDMFMVAELSEALSLREHGIQKPILIAGATGASYAQLMQTLDLRPCVYSYAQALALSQALTQGQLSIHLKLNTGMARLGLNVDGEWEQVEKILSLPHLHLEGVFTHFAESENLSSDFTQQQSHRFAEALRRLVKMGYVPEYRHASNSAAAMLELPTGCNAVRLGIALYGCYPSPAVKECWEAKYPQGALQPVMHLQTRVVQVRELSPGESLGYNRRFIPASPRTVAVLSAGYADGVPRSLSQKAKVISPNCPLVGSVCMDMCFADVTDLAQPPAEGQAVTLFGDKQIPVEDWARAAGTIAYEILCGISPRVPRIYQ